MEEEEERQSPERKPFPGRGEGGPGLFRGAAEVGDAGAREAGEGRRRRGRGRRRQQRSAAEPETMRPDLRRCLEALAA